MVQLSPRALFLLGIREDLLVMAAAQQFQSIYHYKAQVETVTKTVECTFSAGRYEDLQLPPSVEESVTKAGGYVRFRLRGKLHFSTEGLVFGVLPLPNA